MANRWKNRYEAARRKARQQRYRERAQEKVAEARQMVGDKRRREKATIPLGGIIGGLVDGFLGDVFGFVPPSSAGYLLALLGVGGEMVGEIGLGMGAGAGNAMARKVLE